MPAVAGGILRVLGCLDSQYFWIATVTVLHWVNVQCAEAASEGFVLFAIQMLISKDQNLPVQPCLIDLAELLVAEVVAQGYAAYLGADMRRQTVNLNGLVSCYRCHDLPPTRL